MTRTISFLGLVGLALLASSCAVLKKPEPVIKTEYINVSVPVAVACLKDGQVPTQPKRLTEDNPAAPTTLTEIIGRLRAKLLEWQDGYGPTVDELLTICSKVRTP